MNSGLADQAANRKGARRRRFWSSDEKRRMVAESFAPGASVSKVAQRYGVNANLLFTWRRRDARSPRERGRGTLAPCAGEGRGRRAPAAPIAALEPVGRMEIVLAAGERILVGADVTRRRWRAWSRRYHDDGPDPGGRSGVAGDRAHRHGAG
jgi:transposase